jgi:hypothetical protein
MTRPLILLALLTVAACVPEPEQRARCEARLRWARTWPDSQRILDGPWESGWRRTCSELVTPHVNPLLGGDPRLVPGRAQR